VHLTELIEIKGDVSGLDDVKGPSSIMSVDLTCYSVRRDCIPVLSGCRDLMAASLFCAYSWLLTDLVTKIIRFNALRWVKGSFVFTSERWLV